MDQHEPSCAEFGNAGWIPGVGDCQCELIAKVREPLIDMIDELVQQACYMPPEGMVEAYLDSMALSVYADAMHFLALEGRIKITHEYGRRVIAERVRSDGSD